jgi:hypothetical protein
MQHKTLTRISRAIGLVVVCLCLWVQASAQQAAPQRPNAGAARADQPQLMTPVTPAYKLENGIATVDQLGNVTVTTNDDNGNAVTEVIAKPSVNLNVPIGTDMDAYVAGFTRWMKANPNSAQFMTEAERAYAASNDLETLYKINYYKGQEQQKQQGK